MPRSRRNARNSGRSQTHGPQSTGPGAGGPGNQAAAGGRGGGILGWFRDAGSWVGDKVDQATETVGEWADQTAQVARDAWDVATTSSIGMEDGSIYLETDLDELSDLMSAETRAALALDRATADNRVRISYTHSTGELVATSEELALTGVDTDKVQAGQVVLRGVRAVFTNKDGGVPGLGEDFSLLGYKDAADNLQAVVTISSAAAVDVSFTGPDGPSTVASVALEGISGTVGSQGGMPFSEAGTTEVDFALEHAVLEGLAAGGHTVDSAQLSGVSAGMSGSNESAFLAADSVAVAGVAGENSAGNAQIDGLRVDVDNAGGGLLGVDGTADRAAARVAVEAASVTDLDTSDLDASSLSAQNFAGTYDTTSGMGSAALGSLRADGLDTSWVDASRLQADGLAFDGDLTGEDGRRNADLDIARVTGDGLSVTPTTDGRSAAAAGGMPVDWSADVGSIDLTNSQAGGGSVARAQATAVGLSGSVDGDHSGVRGTLQDATLTGLSHSAMQADSLSTTNTSFAADASTLSATADHVRGAGIQTESVRAGELHAYGASASMAGGVSSASLDSARLADATIMDRIDIDSASVDRLSATKGNGSSAVSLGGASVQGLSDRVSGAAVTESTLTQAAIEHRAGTGTVTGTLGEATVSGVSGMGATLQSGSIAGVDLLHGTDGSSVDVDQAAITGLAHGDSRLASATAAGISASRAGGTDQVSVASLGLEGARHGDTAIGSVQAGGLTASQTGDTRRFGASTADVTRLQHGTTSVASLSGAGLSGTQAASGLTGGADSLSASQIQVGDTATVASARADGLALAHGDSGTHASVTSAGLQDARFATDTARGSLTSATVQAGAVSRTDSGLTGGAESLRLQGLAAQGVTSSGGSSSSSGGLDTARLIETTAANVQDAELSAQATLRGGELGVAGLRADPNTQVNAGVSIRGGQVQDQGTGVDLSRRIDGPLWTSVKGAYMDDGRLKADVRGWADQDVTGQVNDALGVRGDRIPSVGTIGSGAANMMRQPSADSSDGPDLSQIVDLNSVRIDANAQLGSGVIDAGIGQVDLGRAQQAGDNRVDVSARNGSLEADIQRFLADSTAFSSGGTSASTGQASASGVDLSATERGWSLEADDIQARDVRGGSQ